MPDRNIPSSPDTRHKACVHYGSRIHRHHSSASHAQRRLAATRRLNVTRRGEYVTTRTLQTGHRLQYT